MDPYEISNEIFEASVKRFITVPKDPTLRETYEPIAYHTFDQFDVFNRIEEEWDDNSVRERELFTRNGGPPPVPRYNQINRGHKITPIEDILEDPQRQSRPEK